MSDTMYTGRDKENPIVMVQTNGYRQSKCEEKRTGSGSARKCTLQEAPTHSWPLGREKGVRRGQGPVTPKMNSVDNTGKGWPG